LFLEYFQLLLIATIIGGMLTFQILFAPMIFIKLPEGEARPFIRKFFPFYYLYFALLALILVFVNYFLLDKGFGVFQLVFSVIVFGGFIISRQVFMPMANKVFWSSPTGHFPEGTFIFNG
jgi:hypothetical protein